MIKTINLNKSYKSKMNKLQYKIKVQLINKNSNILKMKIMKIIVL